VTAVTLQKLTIIKRYSEGDNNVYIYNNNYIYIFASIMARVPHVLDISRYRRTTVKSVYELRNIYSIKNTVTPQFNYCRTHKCSGRFSEYKY